MAGPSLDEVVRHLKSCAEAGKGCWLSASMMRVLAQSAIAEFWGGDISTPETPDLADALIALERRVLALEEAALAAKEPQR